MHTWMIGGQLHVKRLESTGFSESETQEIREELGLTAEAPWAAAERTLDEAVAAKRIYRWIYWPAWPGNCDKHEYAIQHSEHTPLDGLHLGDTREEAAAAAVAFLATLPDSKPALPKPRDMPIAAMQKELWALGWSMSCDCIHIGVVQDGNWTTRMEQDDDETPRAFYIRALMKARSDG